MPRTKGEVAAEHLKKKQKSAALALQLEEEENAARGDRCAVGTKCLMALSKCAALAAKCDDQPQLFQSWRHIKGELQDMMQGKAEDEDTYLPGWYDPFDWKLRALQKLNVLSTVIDSVALKNFVDAIHEASNYEELPRALTIEMPQKMIDLAALDLSNRSGASGSGSVSQVSVAPRAARGTFEKAMLPAGIAADMSWDDLKNWVASGKATIDGYNVASALNNNAIRPTRYIFGCSCSSRQECGTLTRILRTPMLLIVKC